MSCLNEPDPNKAWELFKKELLGGECRWLFSFLALVGIGYISYLMISKEEPVSYFPMYLKGKAVLITLSAGSVLFAVLAIFNWKNWKQKQG
ncbi:MAG: hypothetical protein WDA68_07540 [Phycisphaerae bacterium]